MSYEYLSRKGFIKEIENVTKGTHPRKFCFVLGAGASRNSGIKSGQELVKIWNQDLRERNEDDYNSWRKELKITDDNMSNFYSHYYEKRFARCPKDGLNYIEQIMDTAKPSVGYVMLAHILTTQPHNVVITTNFDHLTEDALTYYAQKMPLVIGHESLAHYIDGQPTRPTIIKIHRDLLFDPKSETKDLEVLAENWKKALECIFENYHPVFIGYAGNDKSLMDFLIENSEKFDKDEWKFPYWLLYKNEAITGKVKEFLDKSKGYAVRCDGFDSIMIELGAAFDYKIPDEKTFLEDATKRYNALKDAIDAFLDKANAKKIEKLQTDTDINIDATEPQKENEDAEIGEAIKKITDQSESQKLYHQANVCISNRKYDKAIPLLNKLLEMEPDNIRYLDMLVRALCYAQQYDEAIEQANKLLGFNPNYVFANYFKGKAYKEKKDYNLAIEAFRKTAECDPKWALPFYMIGETFADLEQYESALDEYKTAVELDPDESLYMFGVGQMLSKLGRSDEALLEYSKAAELSPEWGLIHYLTAKELLITGKYDDALTAINKAISVEPDDYDYYNFLSDILQKLNRPEEAKQAADKAKELKRIIKSKD